MALESENYKNAKERYRQINEQYQGQAGLDLANEQAQQGAEQQAVNAAQQSMAAARNAGMSKAQAAAMGAQNTENIYGNALATNKEQALNKQSTDLTTQQQDVANASTDKTAWDYIGAVGDVASKGAQTIGQIGQGLSKI